MEWKPCGRPSWLRRERLEVVCGCFRLVLDPEQGLWWVWLYHHSVETGFDPDIEAAKLQAEDALRDLIRPAVEALWPGMFDEAVREREES
jgi:hypothetical protein